MLLVQQEKLRLPESRRAVSGARIAVDTSGDVPVIVGIGSHHEHDVLHLAEDAQKAGAKALLVPALSYQRLTPDEVYGLYESVPKNTSVPMVGEDTS